MSCDVDYVVAAGGEGRAANEEVVDKTQMEEEGEGNNAETVIGEGHNGRLRIKISNHCHECDGTCEWQQCRLSAGTSLLLIEFCLSLVPPLSLFLIVRSHVHTISFSRGP